MGKTGRIRVVFTAFETLWGILYFVNSSDSFKTVFSLSYPQNLWITW